LFVDVLSRCELVSKFLAKSQLVILNLQLGWLQQTTDLGAALALSSLRVLLLPLLLVQEELGIVARELTERDQEVTQRRPELVVLGVVGE
jgi:hypothetical protein